MAIIRVVLIGFFLLFSAIDASPVQVDGRNQWQWSSLIRDRESLPDYQPLCQTVSNRVDLFETGYEFRPPFYHTVHCKHSGSQQSSLPAGSQGCLKPGLTCVQKIRTILIAKRRIGACSSCWSVTSRDVPAGCDCMWPLHSLGDSRQHLNLQS